MTLHEIITFAADHKAVLSLLALAFIVTMPEELPKWKDVPNWFYTWFHDGLKAFVSFRAPNVPSQQEKDKQQGK